VHEDAHAQNISHGTFLCPYLCLRKENTIVLKEKSSVLDVFKGYMVVNKFFNIIDTYLS
jgi:hypothetical protein